ncbi:MAG: hypothetical protein ACKVU4_10010 [Phycisphaerales bacterium]
MPAMLPLFAAMLVGVGGCAVSGAPRAGVSVEPAPAAVEKASDTPALLEPFTIHVHTLALVGAHPMFVVQVRNNTDAPIRVSELTLMSALMRSKVSDNQGGHLPWVRDASGTRWHPADDEAVFTTIRPGVHEVFHVHLVGYTSATLSEHARMSRNATVAFVGSMEFADETLANIRTITIAYRGVVDLLLPPDQGEHAATRLSPVSLSRCLAVSLPGVRP